MVTRKWFAACLAGLGITITGAFFSAPTSAAEPVDDKVSAVTFVSEGNTDWRVFSPADAGPVKRFARQQLKRYIERISGARLGDTSRGTDARAICLGLRSKLAVDAALPAPKLGYAAASHQPFHAPPFLHALTGDIKYLVDRNTSGHLVLQYPHGFWWNFSFNLAADR